MSCLVVLVAYSSFMSCLALLVPHSSFMSIQLWSVKIGEDGKAVVEFLSTLNRHSRAVNIVRFSPDGWCAIL